MVARGSLALNAGWFDTVFAMLAKLQEEKL
jgi:hypothetical protein